ncbi:MAG: hypothetical protein HUJ31_07045, partial [Pseudomonadales bacterium]|nr:hypothetical protein [Pseudomonadales bacterium]
MKSNIADIIREYSSQGVHRTGTPVDHESARWLAGRIESLGLEARLDEFDFERVLVHDARLLVGNLEIQGVPLYDCHYTDPDGITGRLGEVGSNAEIGLMMALPYGATPQGQLLEEARLANAHRAIIVVTDERLPPSGPATLNAEHFRKPMGPPVLQVANRHWAELRTALQTGAEGCAIVHAER